ncbi:hypothetical protein [Desulforamulus aeronauticus]|uniref:Uncharacterized protein n=1 Tax=Desulforamulus aeronauticus DSM 10349 TaxID=1121421 RepID=A0A1M6PUQ9_9FIRM|nr:hypothetical protein [Desulforamulus aeronauticus]SHK11612.1 hypothetical protein SAMN02745123_00716 [Desulforamulus aeronauticus DSM 10349]
MVLGEAVTLTTAFLVNLPLGRWREKTRKFSPAWFMAVHLSIPLIIGLRHHFHLALSIIPFTIGSAVLGQLLGASKITIFYLGKYRRRTGV